MSKKEIIITCILAIVFAVSVGIAADQFVKAIAAELRKEAQP